jgi:hypothetical protein
MPALPSMRHQKVFRRRTQRDAGVGDRRSRIGRAPRVPRARSRPPGELQDDRAVAEARAMEVALAVPVTAGTAAR